jgi:hypothetical protein
VELDYLVSHNYVLDLKIVNQGSHGLHLVIQGKRNGVANVKIFIKDQPHIFDVVHVRVTGREEPATINERVIPEKANPTVVGTSSISS